MSLALRRSAYLATLFAIMVLAGWTGTYDAWRTVLGSETGTAMATFWDLQVESWATAPLVVAVLELVYGMAPAVGGGFAFHHRGRRAHVLAYVGLVALTLLCAAEGPWRQVLQPILGDDVGASVAHYFRRALEAPITVIGLMVFMDLVRPGRLVLARRSSAPEDRLDAPR